MSWEGYFSGRVSVRLRDDRWNNTYAGLADALDTCQESSNTVYLTPHHKGASKSFSPHALFALSFFSSANQDSNKPLHFFKDMTLTRPPSISV